ncbi:MAG: quinone-interacting membrane-bound oxidoreductase complex subunit QmoC [Elusimicrobiota bacterium]
MGVGRLIDADLSFIKFLKQSGGEDVKKCYQCATCSAVCSLSPADKPFPRKEMLLASWGQSDKLVKDPDIWLCYQCNDCSTYCPRGAKPGNVLAAVRNYVYQHCAFPSFMGKALASPKALPLLIAAPMAIMAAVFFASKKFPTIAHDPSLNMHTDHITSSTVLLDSVFSIHVVEPLFIAGNILIFICAFMGLWRFWNSLESPAGKAEVGFVAGVILTVKDILTHGRFFDCGQNKPRSWGHMLVFYGFFGAAATAGLGALMLKIMHEPPPIPLGHPVKWLGNLSGLAGIVGSAALLFRRFTDSEEVGANGYQDWLFLIVIFLCFVTGFMTQFTRMSGTSLAFGVYYIHLCIVFFLLWYAPYSKFGHMFYRGLALVHARCTGRLDDGGK